MRRPVEYGLIEEAMARARDGTGGTGTLLGAAAAALEEIASGRRELRAVRHPLGFLCLPVEREGERGVCVHVFGPGARQAAALTTSPVHAHSWDLASCVLYGEVGNLRVRVRENPERPTHRVYEVHSGASSVDEIRPTPRLVTYESGPEETSVGGEIYTLPAGHFHATVVPPGTFAATLLLGRALPGRHDLSLGPVHGTVHRVVRQTCGAERTARTARTVLRRIHGHPSG
ncbi:hypothetical protein [Streptomyces griseocarneus]|uniref:hypothetical protein n=1 Tax=Streptomyces griseocarneus TaxID=51201 RepID=UPI00167D5ACE|nr:hypothetical protein [Streptomyces griseocarneus]MBZ6474325.1 hypothetical protein [Streptomyces griseocarneus]GHG53321.1 hypothetical protein GCM10018779_15220 [Streptomyces griseocarneus]